MNTHEEQIRKIRELEEAFLQKVEKIRAEYQSEIKGILRGIEDRKLEEIRKTLHA